MKAPEFVRGQFSSSPQSTHITKPRQVEKQRVKLPTIARCDELTPFLPVLVQQTTDCLAIGQGLIGPGRSHPGEKRPFISHGIPTNPFQRTDERPEILIRQLGDAFGSMDPTATEHLVEPTGKIQLLIVNIHDPPHLPLKYILYFQVSVDFSCATSIHRADKRKHALHILRTQLPTMRIHRTFPSIIAHHQFSSVVDVLPTNLADAFIFSIPSSLRQKTPSFAGKDGGSGYLSSPGEWRFL